MSVINPQFKNDSIKPCDTLLHNLKSKRSIRKFSCKSKNDVIIYFSTLIKPLITFLCFYDRLACHFCFWFNRSNPTIWYHLVFNLPSIPFLFILEASTMYVLLLKKCQPFYLKDRLLEPDHQDYETS